MQIIGLQKAYRLSEGGDDDDDDDAGDKNQLLQRSQLVGATPSRLGLRLFKSNAYVKI